MAFLCHITLTTTSIASVIFPLYNSMRRCTGSALIQVELQAGRLHSFKIVSVMTKQQRNVITKVIMVTWSIPDKRV